MEVSDREQRKRLNKAWERGHDYAINNWTPACADKRYCRYRDVSKILEAAQKGKHPLQDVDWRRLNPSPRQIKEQP